MKLVALLLAVAVPLVAQETTGSVNGTVMDSTGAVLPGVLVSRQVDWQRVATCH